MDIITINKMITFLTEKAEDPSTQIADLRNIAVYSLKALEESANNLYDAVEQEIEENEDTDISNDIASAVFDAVEFGSSGLEDIAEDLR